MALVARIHADRASLEKQLDQGRLVFADLEAQRDEVIRALAELSRHLDATKGGIQALQALLQKAEPCAESPTSAHSDYSLEEPRP
jgi:phage shock protein A